MMCLFDPRGCVANCDSACLCAQMPPSLYLELKLARERPQHQMETGEVTFEPAKTTDR